MWFHLDFSGLTNIIILLLRDPVFSSVRLLHRLLNEETKGRSVVQSIIQSLGLCTEGSTSVSFVTCFLVLGK